MCPHQLVWSFVKNGKPLIDHGKLTLQAIHFASKCSVSVLLNDSHQDKRCSGLGVGKCRQKPIDPAKPAQEQHKRLFPCNRLHVWRDLTIWGQWP
jgi:hypothetical protein